MLGLTERKKCNSLLIVGSQAEAGDLDDSKKHISRLEGTIASLNEQLKAAQEESKTLKAGSKTAAALERSVKKEQARAEVLYRGLAPKLYRFVVSNAELPVMWSFHHKGVRRIPLLHCKGQGCAIMKAFLTSVQATEKKLQELQASAKQSEDAEAQVMGLQKELEQVQATLQASEDGAKAADSEKVNCEAPS